MFLNTKTHFDEIKTKYVQVPYSMEIQDRRLPYLPNTFFKSIYIWESVPHHCLFDQTFPLAGGTEFFDWLKFHLPLCWFEVHMYCIKEVLTSLIFDCLFCRVQLTLSNAIYKKDLTWTACVGVYMKDHGFWYCITGVFFPSIKMIVLMCACS